MPLPKNYSQSVYAGVLGKVIGVYVGRPFEGWSNENIEKYLGEVWYYVNDKIGHNPPLIVTDDDITGTFAFIRALSEHGIKRDLSAEEIGKTWLNNIIEEKTILWWGGMGNSTEHTAYQRLKSGVPAPRSGSVELNGKIVSEQIGAQIFIDGWGLVCPGDPAQAVRFAKEAGSVSHDGEAVYAAQVVAALIAQAFVEKSMDKLLDTALSFIPADCLISKLIQDVRSWHRSNQQDWRATFAMVKEHYGYDKFYGGCHVIPNHALIILALLHGDSDFQKSIMIVNTCGWDTDCNSANVGCILGVLNGLEGLSARADFRGPVADRVLMPTAEGGECISDALREAYKLIEMGSILAGEPFQAPKGGARFHFSLPGSVQGFQPDTRTDALGVATVSNELLPDGSARALALSFSKLGRGQAARAGTPTFATQQQQQMGGYQLLGCPTLYPSQVVNARVVAETDKAVSIRLFVRSHLPNGQVVDVHSPAVKLSKGAETIEWTVPAVEGTYIEQVGIEATADTSARGTVYLDSLSWSGAPSLELVKAPMKNQSWHCVWIEAASKFSRGWAENAFDIGQSAGLGMVSIGTRDWQDYTVSAFLKSRFFKRGGIAARVQGLRRFYALMLTDRKTVQIVKWLDTPEVLAEAPITTDWHTFHTLELTVKGNRISGSIDGKQLLSVTDSPPEPHRFLKGGALGVVVEDGTMTVREVSIRPE